MEVVRHVCPAAEEDQGAGLVRQMPLEHFDTGFALGIKDDHWLESRVQSGPDIPAFSTTTSSLLYQPQPTALSQRPEEMRHPSHLAPILFSPFLIQQVLTLCQAPHLRLSRGTDPKP